jgi:feruloyl esterase
MPAIRAVRTPGDGRATDPRLPGRRNGRVPVAAIRGLALALTLALPVAGNAAEPPLDAEACAALQALDYAADVGAAVRFAATAALPAAGDQPALCRVAGTIAPTVGFEARLPVSGWNGKLLVTGCTNLCGSILATGFEDALARGYAVASTDLGHRGDQSDATWALNNPAAEADYGHRATHVTTLLAKALVAAYYGARPGFSYFRGCSTGGRQALVAAGRYPDDFDGIIAGAPFHQTLSVPHMAWAVAANTAADGSPILGRPQFGLLARAALAACDGGDGLEDGVIGDPEGCAFDPGTLACGAEGSGECLDSAQVAAARKIYAGPRTSAGESLSLYPGGAPVGSEPTWAQMLLPADGRPAWFAFVVQNWSRYLAYAPDPAGPGPFGFDFDRDPARLRATAAVVGFRPDLRAFRARGGRLILYHGWADESLMPAHTLDYWRRATDTLGGPAALAELARLYMVPGMLHCGGGPGAAEIDFLTALERWVEDGAAPDALIAKRVREPVPTYVRQPRFPLPAGQVLFERPVFPYPDVAEYAGGDAALAASFRRRPPRVPAAPATAAPGAGDR